MGEGGGCSGGAAGGGGEGGGGEGGGGEGGGGEGGGGKGSGGGDTPPCPDDFDPKAMCEGGPKDNYCMYMNILYYCENGSWKAYNGGGGKNEGGKGGK